MKTPLQSFKRPSGPAKTFLRWVQNLFLLAGFVTLAWYSYIQAETFLFQSYQSWRLDQLQQGRPASVALFVKQWLPIPWKKGVPLHSPAASTGRPGSSTMPAPRAEGELIGRLAIPRLDLSAIVLEGIDTHTLRLAVGHLPGTPLPGDRGDVDLAAHRDTFFRRLNNIRRGDVVTVSTLSGVSYLYRVATTAIVSPNNTSVLNSSAGPGLNLITCYPFYYVGAAPKRFVVHADQIAASARPLDPNVMLDGTTQRKDRKANRILSASLIHGPAHSAHAASKRVSHSSISPGMQDSSAGVEVRNASMPGEDTPSAADESLPPDSISAPAAKSSRPHANPLRAFFRKVFKTRL